MIGAGDIVDYSYLWHRQASAGEEAGRKTRPCCLAVVSRRDPERLFLFPVTSRPPGRDRVAHAFTEIECRRAGLRHPAWLILDEYNVAARDYVTDFGALRPRGHIGPTSLKIVLGIIRRLQSARGLRGVKRDMD